MDKRRQFVEHATEGAIPFQDLCADFGIARSTGYRVLARYRADGDAGLIPASTRPHTSPAQTDDAVEAQVIAVRAAYPTWGGRKIHAWLHRQNPEGADRIPAPSTITAILRRHGLLGGKRAGYPRAYHRFAYAASNQLWQMDFVGHRGLSDRTRVHPLTMLDDHSRFLLGLVACADERSDTAKAALIAAFRTYGLPDRILADNGPAWGTSKRGGLNRLEAWLLRLDVHLIHGRPRHPQTQGKVERCNQTIGRDLLRPSGPFANRAVAQDAFDQFRIRYNTERPHDALDLAVPAEYYQPSARVYPETLPPLIYPATDLVRTVASHGGITVRGTWWYVSEGLVGEPVAVRPTAVDGVFTVYYASRRMRDIDLRTT